MNANLTKIQSEIYKVAAPSIPIQVDKKIYDVASAASTPGSPKSDFHLLDSRGREVVWISHKDGHTSKCFQQWGGMSPRFEPDIAAHEESADFVEEVREIFGSVLPNKISVGRIIKDKILALKSVYGNQFGQEFGRQNVSVLLQGPVNLVKYRDRYLLNSVHTYYNGEEMEDNYSPTFTAIYKGDRNNFQIKGARFAIHPIGSRKMYFI